MYFHDIIFTSKNKITNNRKHYSTEKAEILF